MSQDKDRIRRLDLTMHYAHPLGEIAPYFQGLEKGLAVAARCPTCKRTWFPPRLLCPEHGRATAWTELSGRGRIVGVSLSETVLPFGAEKARRAFLLVAMDGAENAAFGRLDGDPDSARVGMAVRLKRAEGDWPHPAQAAVFVIDR